MSQKSPPKNTHTRARKINAEATEQATTTTTEEFPLLLSSSLARDALALAEAISLSHTLAAAVIKTHSPSKTRKRARGCERRGEVTTTTTTTAESETGRVVSRSLSHSLELATETEKNEEGKTVLTGEVSGCKKSRMRLLSSGGEPRMIGLTGQTLNHKAKTEHISRERESTRESVREFSIYYAHWRTQQHVC